MAYSHTDSPVVFYRVFQNYCTNVRPRILEKSSRMNLCRFLSVCRPDNDPIDCPRFFKNKSNDQTYPFEPIYNFIINTLHYSYKQHTCTFVKMTSGCQVYSKGCNQLLHVRMEFRFAIKFGRHCLCLSHTLKPDRSYNRFEFG